MRTKGCRFKAALFFLLNGQSGKGRKRQFLSMAYSTEPMRYLTVIKETKGHRCFL